MNNIYIALAQLDVTAEIEVGFNILRGALLMAKEQGADIVLFPELWTVGYSERPDDADERKLWENKSTWLGDSLYEKYAQLAKEVGISFVFTYLESNEDRTEFYNSAALIDTRGTTVLNYRKTHTVDKCWEIMFTPGDDFPVAELKTANGTIKVGIMICYDREFPEVSRLLMLNGAELVLVPNACKLESNRIAQFQTRGFENMLAVAMANYPRLGGVSVAFDGMRKKGEDYDPTLVKLGNEETIAMAELDIDKLREYRNSDIWGDAYRKPHLYGKLTENDPKPPFIRDNARR